MKITVYGKPTRKTLSDTLVAIGEKLPAASKYRDALIDKADTFTLNFRVDIALQFVEGAQRSMLIATVRSLIDRGLYKEMSRQYVLDKDLPDGLLLDWYSGTIAGAPTVVVGHTGPMSFAPTRRIPPLPSESPFSEAVAQLAGLKLEIAPPKKSSIEDIQSMCRLMRTPVPTLPVIADLWDRPNPLVDEIDGISLGGENADCAFEVPSVDQLGSMVHSTVTRSKDLRRQCVILAPKSISSTLKVPDYQLVPFRNPSDIIDWIRSNPEVTEDKLIPVSTIMHMLMGYRFPPVALDIIVVTKARLPRTVIWQLRGRTRPEPARVIELYLKKEDADV